MDRACVESEHINSCCILKSGWNKLVRAQNIRLIVCNRNCGLYLVVFIMYLYVKSRVTLMRRWRRWKLSMERITVYERIWQMYWIWLKSTACGRFSRFLHCFSWVFNQISFHMMTNNCMRARCAACRDLRLLTFNVCAFIWINVFNEFFCRVRPTSSNQMQPTKEAEIRKVNQFGNHILCYQHEIIFSRNDIASRFIVALTKETKKKENFSISISLEDCLFCWW